MATRDELLQSYLDILRDAGTRVKAARQAGIAYATVMARRRDDPEFAAAEDEALDEAADLLEAEARRRAFEGVERTKIVNVGGEAREYVETTYSDTLLMFLLKGQRPDKFADRTKSELSGPGGKEIEINDTTAAARIAGLLEAAKQRKANDPLS